MSNKLQIRGSLILWLLSAVLIHVPGAAAEVRVSESGSGAIMVEAHKATVQEVLDALRGLRAIEFRSTEALSRTITGTYSGTLEHVLARILDGYDRVIRSTSSGLHLDIVGSGSAADKAMPAAAAVVAAPAYQAGPPAVKPNPARQHQPRMVRGYLDLDGELSQ